MDGRRILLIVLSCLALIEGAEAKKKRVVRIQKKIPTDTIVIPDNIFADELPSDTVTPIFEEPIEEMAVESVVLDKIDGTLSILGESTVSPETMISFVLKRNPDFNPEIARAFYEIGQLYGIRGDVALCQSIIETGWFLFTGGTAVTLDQNNFCGLGVTKKGLRGNSFDSVKDGVTAQIQHLFAYATTDRLPSGEKTIDPRFSLVCRGVAPTWNDLSMRWAANSHYGESIIRVYKELLQHKP